MTMWTYIGQIVNFLVFMGILYLLLYKPVGRMMRERKQEMEAELREAGEKLEEAKKLRADAEERAKELEAMRDSMLKEAQDQADAQRKELTQRVENLGRERLERFRRIMAQERSELLEKLADELRATIAEVTSSVLGDAPVGLTDRALERVEALLDEMPEEDIEGARKALADLENRVDVRSATILSDKQVDRLRNALGQKLGAENIELLVNEDSSLIAGVEIMVGHLNLEAHWRGVIDAALQERMARDIPKQD